MKKKLLLVLLVIASCNYSTAQDYYKLGLEKYKNFQYNQAIDDFSKYIDKNNSNTKMMISINTANSYYYRGVCFYYLAEYEKAITNLSESYKRNTYLQQNFSHTLALVFIYSKKYNEAIELLNTCIDNYKKNLPTALYYRALTYKHLNNIEAYNKDLMKIIELDEKSSYKAYALQLTGKPDKALEYLENNANKKPMSSDYYNLAAIYAMQNNKEKAYLNIEMFLSMDFKPLILSYDDSFENLVNEKEFTDLLIKHGLRNLKLDERLEQERLKKALADKARRDSNINDSILYIKNQQELSKKYYALINGVWEINSVEFLYDSISDEKMTKEIEICNRRKKIDDDIRLLSFEINNRFRMYDDYLHELEREDIINYRLINTMIENIFPNQNQNNFLIIIGNFDNGINLLQEFGAFEILSISENELVLLNVYQKYGKNNINPSANNMIIKFKRYTVKNSNDYLKIDGKEYSVIPNDYETGDGTTIIWMAANNSRIWIDINIKTENPKKGYYRADIEIKDLNTGQIISKMEGTVSIDSVGGNDCYECIKGRIDGYNSSGDKIHAIIKNSLMIEPSEGG